jgi:ubiquinone biosynthesis protein
MALPITRYEQIAAVLVKYGFEVAVVDLLPNAIQWRLRKQKVDTSNLSVHKRMKLAIQELGPTFVKFGQIMSTRRELLSPDLVEELKQLTDKVQPVPWESVEPTIKAYVGNIDDVFVYLNKRPFAAASLSQAHHGKLKDGTVVVLKVQRPGIKAVIETDLRILKAIADQAEKTSSSLEIFNFPAMVTDFARQILSELDFVRDGKNADLFRKNMAEFEKVKIPKIYWQYSGERLLVMEYMRGVKIDKTEQILKMGVDPEAVARLGLHVYMKQIFDDGFFHGDPHPGNLLVTRSGDLILLDFGLIGVLRPEKRNLLMKMLMTILDRDVDGLTDVLTDLGMRVKDSWMDAFKDDLYLALISGDTYNEEQPDPGAVEGLISALRKYKLRVPMATMLMLKVISMVEDDAIRLYPRFDFLTEIKPLITESFTKRVLNQANIKKAGLDFAEAIFEAKDIPNNVNLALKKISQGSFTWRIAHDDIDRIGGSIDRASYKIMLGLIIASIVVGTSLVVLATREVLSLELFQVTVAIFIAAILIGLFAVLQIIRGRGKR